MACAVLGADTTATRKGVEYTIGVVGVNACPSGYLLGWIVFVLSDCFHTFHASAKPCLLNFKRVFQ